MPHYVAIVEDAGPDKAIGLWFPDLPGCFSAGDTVDEALLNAGEALSLYAESLAKEGRPLPAPRSVTARAFLSTIIRVGRAAMRRQLSVPCGRLLFRFAETTDAHESIGSRSSG